MLNDHKVLRHVLCNRPVYGVYGLHVAAQSVGNEECGVSSSAMCERGGGQMSEM